MEEEYVQQICNDIIRIKPDLVITEKGVSDLAQVLEELIMKLLRNMIKRRFRKG